MQNSTPEHLHQLLSNNNTSSKNKTPTDNNTTSLVNNTFTKCITLNGIKYRSISHLNVVYFHSHALTKKSSLLNVVPVVDCMVLIPVLSRNLDA